MRDDYDDARQGYIKNSIGELGVVRSVSSGGRRECKMDELRDALARQHD